MTHRGNYLIIILYVYSMKTNNTFIPPHNMNTGMIKNPPMGLITEKLKRLYSEPASARGIRPNMIFLEEIPADIEIGPGILQQIEDITKD